MSDCSSLKVHYVHVLRYACISACHHKTPAETTGKLEKVHTPPAAETPATTGTTAKQI